MTGQNAHPLIICVAPNGARKTQADHPHLPILPHELADCAVACRDAGAAMMHLHVRDSNDEHSLDVARYRSAIAAIRNAVGQDLILQVTTEAVGKYRPAEQMEIIRELKPEAFSAAVRELIPDDAHESQARAFFLWAHDCGINVQYILYSGDDLKRFKQLRAKGVIPERANHVLYVLGRYAKDQRSSPSDLLDFMGVTGARSPTWAVCAFGALEAACVLTAAGMGGHARVGFENNLLRADGAIAKNNAALVAQVASAARLFGRAPADATTARRLLGI